MQSGRGYQLTIRTVSVEDAVLDNLQYGRNNDGFGKLSPSWKNLPIKRLLQCANLPKCTLRGVIAIKQKPDAKALKEAVEAVLKSPEGRTGWIASFKEPVDMSDLVASNAGDGVQRYVIPVRNQRLLFVNKAMYDFWTEHLQKDADVKVENALTEQTDGFLPIVFAASVLSSVTKTLTVAADVDVKKGCDEYENPFREVFGEGGGRSGWSIVLENEKHNPFRGEEKVAITGALCDLKLSKSNGAHVLTFLPCGDAAKMIFESSYIKNGIDEEDHKINISNDWFDSRDQRVPLGIVLEYVEKHSPESNDILEIEVGCNKYTDKPLVGDLKAFLPKAGKSKRPWELLVKCSYDNAENFAEEINKLNQKTLRYGFKAEKKSNTLVSVISKEKTWSERVEDDGTLTLGDEDVAGKTVWTIFKDVLDNINRKEGAGTKVKNLVLPFRLALYEDVWKNTSIGADKDPTLRLREALTVLCESKDLAGLKTLTLTSTEGLDANALEQAVNKILREGNINRRVRVSPEGVITFEEQKMPKFESEKDIISEYRHLSNDRGWKKKTKSVSVLKWTREWTEWFERPETDFGEFIEALAEHPEIDCVDFSKMPGDSVGHKKYLTEDAVRQLLKAQDVRFICRCSKDDTDASKGTWTRRMQAYGLNFAKKDEIVVLDTFENAGNPKEQTDSGWVQMWSEASCIVAKSKQGKRRLLWNRAALNAVLNASNDEAKMDVLEKLSGRKEKYDNTKTKDADGQPLVPYKAIDTIDFTIGEPNTSLELIKKDCKWENVHKIVNKKKLWQAIGQETDDADKKKRQEHIRCVSMLAYEDCIGKDAKKAITKAGWVIKPHGKKGERKIVEIKYDGIRSKFQSGVKGQDAFDSEDEFVSELEKVFGKAKFMRGKSDKREDDRKDERDQFNKLFDLPSGSFFNSVSEKPKEWVRASKKDGAALRVNMKAKEQYDLLPFDVFMEGVTEARKGISKVDLTDFDDKGGKVTFKEFLKYPMWTFTIPSTRREEVEKSKKDGFVKIQKKKDTETDAAITFIVLPRLQSMLTKNDRPENGRAEWCFEEEDEKVLKEFFDLESFGRQLKDFIRMKKPDIVSMKSVETPAKMLADEKTFKAFFNSKDFRGVGFEFPTGSDFEKAVETYNKAEDVKNKLAWLSETNGTYPAVMVLPGKLDRPENANASKAWLEGKKGTETITRLEKLKLGLKREAKYVLEKDLEDCFSNAVDAMRSDEWQVVVGFEVNSDKNPWVKMDNDVPKVLVDGKSSFVRGAGANFALRLCNGFPLSEKQRKAFRTFACWAQDFSGKNLNYRHDKSCIVKSVLRFFLSYPDMALPFGFCTTEGYSSLWVSKEWKNSWNFTFGQLYAKYEGEIPWRNDFFKTVKLKGGDRIEKGDYVDAVGKWVNKNDTFRNESDRKKVEKRFKAFLKSLRGFDDWDTAGGDMKRWEAYQLKRWEAYADLETEDKDLPESLLNKAAIDAYEAKKIEAAKKAEEAKKKKK